VHEKREGKREGGREGGMEGPGGYNRSGKQIIHQMLDDKKKKERKE